MTESTPPTSSPTWPTADESNRQPTSGVERATRRYHDWFPGFSAEVDELVAETQRQSEAFSRLG